MPIRQSVVSNSIRVKPELIQRPLTMPRRGGRLQHACPFLTIQQVGPLFQPDGPPVTTVVRLPS